MNRMEELSRYAKREFERGRSLHIEVNADMIPNGEFLSPYLTPTGGITEADRVLRDTFAKHSMSYLGFDRRSHTIFAKWVEL